MLVFGVDGRRRGLSYGDGMTEDLDAAIQAKVTAGLLPAPCNSPRNVSAGFDGKCRCDACDKFILACDFAYKVDVPDTSSLRFHRKCYWAWLTIRASSMPGVE
jgi:hypothetical protein